MLLVVDRVSGLEQDMVFGVILLHGRMLAGGGEDCLVVNILDYLVQLPFRGPLLYLGKPKLKA